MPPKTVNPVRQIVENFGEARGDYSAAKSSRFRRYRSGTLVYGSSADWHYRVPADYVRIIEQARDMDRNDPIPGQAVDRAVDNTVHSGVDLDPQVPEKGRFKGRLNKVLKEKWHAWGYDPNLCDITGEMTWDEMTRLALRHMFVDGDVFALLLRSGQMQMIEGHRARRPVSTTVNVVHGILLDEQRRQLEYWFTKDDIDPWRPIQYIYEIKKFRVRDKAGNRIALHLHNAKRITQTRGLSAFAPMFDVLGMFEDIQFAKLVQQQVVSCFAVFRERVVDFEGSDPGARGAETTQTLLPDGSTRTSQGISPGMEIRGEPGEKLQGFSPAVPNAEFFDHVRLILTLVGLNLGLPLVMTLMDASEANFSSFRAAVDQAKLGFKRNHRKLVERWCRPTYEWKLRQWIDEDPYIRAAHEAHGDALFRHRWSKPVWPYIDPLKDRQAELLAVRNGLTSYRRLHAERGESWDEVSTEMVEDSVMAIRKAKQAAMSLNGEIDDGQPVHWRELLSLPTPDGLALSLMPEGASSEEPAKPVRKPKERSNA